MLPYLLKAGAWATIGGITTTGVFVYMYDGWGEGKGDFYIPKKDTLEIFLIGAVAGAIFKVLGLPALELLGKGTILAGRAVYNQKENVYYAAKWLFTK